MRAPRLLAMLIGLSACAPTLDTADAGSNGGASGSAGGKSGTAGGGGAGASSGIAGEYTGDAGWAWAVDATTDASVQSVAVDSKGNIVVGGMFGKTLGFPSPGAKCSSATMCGFVAKLDPTGALLWRHLYLAREDTGSIGSIVVAIGPADEVAVAGAFSGPVDFGAGPVGSHAEQVYVVGYDAAGGLRWSSVTPRPNSS